MQKYRSDIESNRAGDILLTKMMAGGFEIYNPTLPTYNPGNNRHKSYLDILISNSSLVGEQPITAEDLGSDHLPFVATLDGRVQHNADFDIIPSIRNANWTRFRHIVSNNIDLKQFQLSTQPSPEQIDAQIVSLNQTLLDAAERSIPKTKVQRNGVRPTRETLELIRLRRNTRRRYNRSGRLAD